MPHSKTSTPVTIPIYRVRIGVYVVPNITPGIMYEKKIKNKGKKHLEKT